MKFNQLKSTGSTEQTRPFLPGDIFLPVEQRSIYPAHSCRVPQDGAVSSSWCCWAEPSPTEPTLAGCCCPSLCFTAKERLGPFCSTNPAPHVAPTLRGSMERWGQGRTPRHQHGAQGKEQLFHPELPFRCNSPPISQLGGALRDNQGAGLCVQVCQLGSDTVLGVCKGKAGLGPAQILPLFTFSLSTAPAKLKSWTASSSGVLVTAEKGV